VPAALVAVGGIYALQLAVDDAPLDVAAPAFAAGMVVAAELAYWSLDERERAKGERGDGLRRLALLAGLGVATLLVTALLLAAADALRTRGLGIDVVGAAAAALALVAIVLFARGRGAARDW
jgi:ABC-type transport system involved in cytochrome c biogenesis permease subunit